MHPDELARHLAVLTNAIAAAIRSDPSARETARTLANWLMRAAGDAGETARTADQPAPLVEASAPPAVVATPAPVPSQSIELIFGGQRLTLSVPSSDQDASAARDGGERSAVPSAPSMVASPAASPQASSGLTTDLSLVAKRCRIKAEGCAWAAQYRAHYDPNDLEGRSKYKDIIARARELPGCYVWATNPNLVIPPTSVVRDFALAYSNLAHAAEIALLVHQSVDAPRETLSETYHLLAEAQSAIRAALEAEGLFVDDDQYSAFQWLKGRTAADRILVLRHMKLDDPAGIADGASLAAKIVALEGRLNQQRFDMAQRRAQLNKVRYHARRLLNGEGDEPAKDWTTIVNTVTAIVSAGARPSDIDLREQLLPLVDLMPADLPATREFGLVMDAMDQYIATQEANLLRAAALPPRQWSPQVREAADLLAGGVAVLVGGQCRQESRENLRNALELADVWWISSTEHQSLTAFEPSIARPETCIVLLAIRWSSHSFEGVKAMCERYGKPFVRLPGGYNPNQVAAQILSQTGESLRDRVTA